MEAGRWNHALVSPLDSVPAILDISAKRLAVLEDVFGHQTKPLCPIH